MYSPAWECRHAELFPLLNGQGFEALCADIQANGLLNPIVENDGLILDGRNRLRACERVGIPARYVQFSSLGAHCTPEVFIWSQNIARRHVISDQRPMIAVGWRERLAAEAKERLKAAGKAAGRSRPQKGMVNSPYPISKGDSTTRHKLAELAQVTEHKIRQAEAVAAVAPDLAAKVTSGEMTLRAAVRATQPEPKQDAKKRIWDTCEIMAELLAAIKAWVRRWPPEESYRSLILYLRNYADFLEKRERQIHESNPPAA
jgi:hypothetical protein